jgi:hypothetical protein
MIRHFVHHPTVNRNRDHRSERFRLVGFALNGLTAVVASVVAVINGIHPLLAGFPVAAGLGVVAAWAGARLWLSDRD